MKNKARKKYTWNFLNNQNYVLGNTEKKKILSKFFIEKLIHFLYKMSLSFKSSLDLFVVLLLFIFFVPLWFVVLLFVLKVNPFIAFFLSTTIVFIFSIIMNFTSRWYLFFNRLVYSVILWSVIHYFLNYRITK